MKPKSRKPEERCGSSGLIREWTVMGGRPNKTSFGLGRVLHIPHPLYFGKESGGLDSISSICLILLLVLVNAVSRCVDFSFHRKYLVLLELETKGL